MLRERDNGDRQAIAHHEAGHAVVARALGRPVGLVTIVPSPGRLGAMWPILPSPDRRTDDGR